MVKVVEGKFGYHFTDGNRKLGAGIKCWGTLHGDWERNVEVIDLDGEAVQLNESGTCQNCEVCSDDCYCNKSERMYVDSLRYRAINTYGLRAEPDAVFAMLDLQLRRARKVSKVRINTSGDLTSQEEFVRWCELATAHPTVSFYVYTKMYDYVESVLLGGGVPSNMVVLYSLWASEGVKEFEKVKHLKNVKAFVFDDGTCEVKITHRCTAYEENRKLGDWTCDQCGLCYRGTAKVIGCRPH